MVYYAVTKEPVPTYDRLTGLPTAVPGSSAWIQNYRADLDKTLPEHERKAAAEARAQMLQAEQDAAVEAYKTDGSTAPGWSLVEVPSGTSLGEGVFVDMAADGKNSLRLIRADRAPGFEAHGCRVVQA
ncbi:MAG: hypothetical protein ACJ8AW_31410 [Rhodopila sp.]